MIIKAISPLFRYDGEPSVSNGITYQLPSSHLFIHRVPAKLSNRVYALWSKLLPATALVYLWLLTDLTGSAQHDSVDATLCLSLVGLLLTGIFPLSPSGSFPEPCSISEVSEPQQDSGILLCFILLMQPGFPAWIPAGYLLTSSGDHTWFPSSKS